MSENLTDEQRANLIRALLREKAGYEQYGRTFDAAQVDEQLKLLGHGAAAPAKRATQMKRKAGTEL